MRGSSTVDSCDGERQSWRRRDLRSPIVSTLANIDAKRMRAASVTSTDGIDVQTIFSFRQSGRTVWASYRGGNIAQGFLIGTIDGRMLSFDYIQMTQAGRRDKGESRCELGVSRDGRLQLTERFQWSSRDGAGINVLEEIPE